MENRVRWKEMVQERNCLCLSKIFWTLINSVHVQVLRSTSSIISFYLCILFMNMMIIFLLIVCNIVNYFELF